MKTSLTASLVCLTFSTAFAAGNPCAAGKPALDPKTITRPTGYVPMAGDT